MFPYTVLNESVLHFTIGEGISDDTRRRVQAVATLLRQANWSWLTDVVPAYTTVTLHTDFAAICQIWPRAAVPIRAVGDWVQSFLEAQHLSQIDLPNPRVHRIGVRYDGEDLANLAARLHISVEEAIAQHTECVHTVFFNGFAPGFAYMGLLPEVWAIPRLATPSPVLVAPGTVAVANRQTVIYPTPTPRGWHIVGHTDAVLFDATLPDPCLLQAGDTVHFYAI